MLFVLNQFPRNSRQVSFSWLPCEDVPIFLEEFDEHKFVFAIQTIAHVSDHGRLPHGQQNGFAERVLQLDGRLGLRHYQVWGRLSQILLQVLEFCGCCESVNRLVALSIIVKGLLDVSPNGDDIMQSQHL
jgi:hypothetical protein